VDETCEALRLGLHDSVKDAHHLEDVGPSAPAAATRGSIGVGDAGIWTGVWELWVGNVHVPGYGRGHMVVIVTMSTQAGISHPRRGQVIASWFAP
jgi:hypothetical protein